MEPGELEKKKEEFKQKLEINRAERQARLIEYWNNLKPFKEAKDVPNLPNVGQPQWNDFYVPRLLKAGAITKEDLVDGVWYYGEYRNSNFGKWNANKQEFGLWRHKFGWMWDTCTHFQDDNGFALFVPIRAANTEEIEQQNKIEAEKNGNPK
jgi:hypothetical protein